MLAAEPFPDTLDKGLHMPPSTSGSIALWRFTKILIQLGSFARRPLTPNFTRILNLPLAGIAARLCHSMCSAQARLTPQRIGHPPSTGLHAFSVPLYHRSQEEQARQAASSRVESLSTDGGLSCGSRLGVGGNQLGIPHYTVGIT
jgi:hypothetical protein